MLMFKCVFFFFRMIAWKINLRLLFLCKYFILCDYLNIFILIILYMYYYLFKRLFICQTDIIVVTNIYKTYYEI